MDLIDLILTVCLLADPGRCRIEHLRFESRGSLFQCTVLAPAEIARWAQQHPSLRVVRWRCALPERGREL